MLDTGEKLVAGVATAALDDEAWGAAVARWWDAVEVPAVKVAGHKARRLVATAAILFPDERRFWDVIAGLPANTWGHYVNQLCAAAPDYEALAPLIDVVEPAVLWSAIDAAGLILRGGGAAADGLRPVFLAAHKYALKGAGWRAPTLDDSLSVGFATFAILGDVDVLRALLKDAVHPRALMGLQAAVTHAPTALLNACLAEGVVSPGVSRDLALHVARAGVVVDDDRMSTLRAVLDAGTGVVPTAALPVTLQSPPWRGRTVAAPPRRPGLVPVAPADIDVADACVLLPTEAAAVQVSSSMVADARQRLAGYGAPVAAITDAAPLWQRAARGEAVTAPVSIADAIDLIDKRLQHSWGADDSGAVAFIDDALVRPLWRAFHPTAWVLNEKQARVLVARLGVFAIDGMLARAGLAPTVPPPTHGLKGAMAPQTTARLGPSLAALEPVASTRIAPAVAQGLMTSRTRRAALNWLRRHPRHGAVGLIPLALDEPTATAVGAREGLRLLAALGHGDVVAAAARAHGDDVVAAVDAILAADPLALPKAPRTPGWLEVRRLPPLRTSDGRALDDDASAIAVGVVAASTPQTAYPAFADLQATVTSSSLSAWVWALWRQWWLAGSPSADAWVFAGLVHAGDVVAARMLGELMLMQSRERQVARARQGVDVLEAMGERDESAIIVLRRFQKAVKGKSLVIAAEQAIERLATAKGLNADELADRLVPDLGLGDDGALVLDLGAGNGEVGAGKTLRLTFDALLRPRYQLPDGAVVDRFPPLRKGGKGDKVAHAAAKATAKAIAKEAAEAAKIVLSRLERLLRARRDIDVETARRCFFGHPLVMHIARRLVWTDLRRDSANGDDTVSVVGAFRVAEDGTFADANDDAYVISGTHVGLLHPADADAAVVERFRGVFRDYELMQPFPQLDRPVLSLSADERADVVRRYEGRVVDTARLFTLEARGWQRGGGGTTSVLRVGGGDVTLTYRPGISGGPDAYRGDQTLGPLTFQGSGSFAGLTAVEQSELLYDLERLFVATSR